MKRITGQQARELLVAATPGPWECHLPDRDDWWIRDVPTADKYSGVLGHGGMQDEGDARLAAAAPDLAETVAWLYGREADAKQVFSTHAGYIFSSGGVVSGTWLDEHLTPDEAVDLARALLAAAEEARS